MLAQRPRQEKGRPPGDRLLGRRESARLLVEALPAQAALVPAGLADLERQPAQLQEVRGRARAPATPGVQLELLLQRQPVPEDEDAVALRRRHDGRGRR